MGTSPRGKKNQVKGSGKMMKEFILISLGLVLLVLVGYAYQHRSQVLGSGSGFLSSVFNRDSADDIETVEDIVDRKSVECLFGIDVSHYQGNIDWQRLTQTRQSQFPIHFIFMKASEGGDYGDRVFQANFDSAKAYGFIRGAYHFYNPKTDPVRQADFFINSVKLDTGDLPPVLDIEKRGDDARTLRRDLKIWLDKIERHYKVKPILYTSYKFKTRYLNDSIFDSYPYWIAHYYVDSVEYKGNWKFWQHTDVGTLPGIREKVDLNIFNGSLEELKCMTIR